MSAVRKIAVIGGGPAGLFAGQILSSPRFFPKNTPQVTLFESHSKPGGCASFFRRKLSEEETVAFDAGATLLNGVNEGQFLSRLLKNLDVPTPKFWPTPHVHFWMEGRPNARFTVGSRSGQEFIEDLAKNFPTDAAWIKRDLPELFEFARALVATLEQCPVLPVQEPADLWRNYRALRLNPAQLRFAFLNRNKSLGEWIKERHASPAFIEWVEMTMMITLQCRSFEALLPWGVLAMFFYPLGIGTAEGGMKAFFEALLTSLKTRAEVHMKEAVTRLYREGKKWFIETAEKNYGPFDLVFSSVPRFNTEKLLGQRISPPALSFENLKRELWTALVGYFVANDHPSLPEDAFNLHVKTKAGEEVYYSFSRRADLARAPQHLRAITASTHWTLYDKFTEENYEAEKKKAGDNFLKAPLIAAMPEISLRFEEYGTPETFLHYTKRLEGTVGGIPLNRHHTLWQSAPIRTPHPGLFQIGDTSFPGQSIYACALGALLATQIAMKIQAQI